MTALDRVEFAPLSRLVPDNPVTIRQREEQERYLSETRTELENQRKTFEAHLDQIRRDHLDRLIDDVIASGFEAAHGDISPSRRHQLAIVTRSSNAIPIDIANALKAANRKAGDSGKTPVVLLAEAGPISKSGSGRSPIRRVLLIADLGDIAPSQED